MPKSLYFAQKGLEFSFKKQLFSVLFIKRLNLTVKEDMKFALKSDLILVPKSRLQFSFTVDVFWLRRKDLIN